MHEIITLQLGQRANYLATHFWNLQESYFTYSEGEESLVDPDVHFRAGIGADGTETFLPRTVIYDLKGAFGTLRKNNALYELNEDSNPGQGLWIGKEVLHQQKQIPQSDYQKSLDLGLPTPQLNPGTVRFWSDYSRVFYHPRSVVQLNDYELNSRTMPFEDWTAGEELFDDLDKDIDLLDRDLRPFAEECDQLRALQLFTGSDDAWGGFASRYVDRLRDEFGKKNIWVWAIEGGSKQSQSKRDMNKARCVYTVSPQSSLYTPIIDAPRRLPSSLHVDFQSEWYTSALVVSAVETVTLPSRLRQHYDFETSLAGVDDTRKIFELQSTFAGNGEEDPRELSDSSKHLYMQELESGSQDKVQTDFDVDFTYDDIAKGNKQTFNQLQIVRGVESTHNDAGETEHFEILRKMRLQNSEPMLQRFRTPLRFPILDSYPRDIFSTPDPESGVPIVASLTSSSRTAHKVQDLQTAASRLIAVDEREALTNGLGEIREAYETRWMSDSDEDED